MSQAPSDTIMRVYTAKRSVTEVAAHANKLLRHLHAESTKRALTAPLLNAPSTQVVLGAGFECFNVLLPGVCYTK